MQYAFKLKEKTAQAQGTDLSISVKDSIEISNRIRKLSFDKAVLMLEDAIKMKTPIKFTKFTNGAGHKTGMGSGKYPINASKEILRLLKSAKANANNKGLSDDLFIENIVVNKASRPWRYGRHRGRKAKRTHIQLQLAEKVKKTIKKAD